MDLFKELQDVDRQAVERFVNVEPIDEISYQELEVIMRSPEIMPCAFDGSMEFWIERVSLWGTPIITYKGPDGRKEKLTKGKFLELMGDPTLLNTFGKWNLKKLSIKSVEIFRNYYGPDGKKHNESIIVDIDLKPHIKKALKGKF